MWILKIKMMNNDYIKQLMIDVCCGSTRQRFDKICLLLQNKNINYICESARWNNSNIIIPAKIQKNKIVVTAHYDVVPNSLGFNDNTSGVITALIVYYINRADNVEIVFTDGEECGGGGADCYIKQHKSNILCNINIDVDGLPGSIYVDNNIVLLNGYLDDCRLGVFPFCDGHVFREYNINSISFSSGPPRDQMSFDKGISYIFSTIHNNKYDNDISIISFDMINNVAKKIVNIINIINENYI